MHLVENDLSPEALAAETGAPVAEVRTLLAMLGDAELVRAALVATRSAVQVPAFVPSHGAHALGFAL